MRLLNVLFVCLLVSCSGAMQGEAAGKAVPKASGGLVLEPAELDMGKAKEGEKVTAELVVRNTGSSFAQIVSVETSCGCTTAEPETRMLAPGAFTRLRVVVDTFGKRGTARKWVKVFDGEGHEVTAWLILHVLPNPHLDVKGRSLFSGKCGACHYQPAVGLSSGQAIYKAVCAMCHGADAKGDYAPGLRRFHDAGTLASIIAHGTGTSHMPGFARPAGGPLNERQLDALVRWVLSLDD